MSSTVDDVPSRNVLLPGYRERTIGLGEGYQRRGGLWLPPSDAPESPAVSHAAPIGIGLFVGAGGFDLGFTQAGFHVAAASDGWATSAWTYLVNLGTPETLVCCIGDELPEGSKREKAWHAEHRDEMVPADEFIAMMRKLPAKDARDIGGDRTRVVDGGVGSGWIANQKAVQGCEVYYLGDVRALTGKRILDDLELTSDDIGCVFGGPPCQGFSRAGKQDRNDPRNELTFEFMRVVCEIHPRAFCMENVPAILDMVTRDGVPVIDALAMMAEEGGMGTFEAIRRSLAESAGVGAALRTRKAGASKPRPGSTTPRHRLDIDADEPEPTDQMDLFAGATP